MALLGFNLLELGTWAAFLIIALYLYRARRIGSRLSSWSFVALAVLAAFGVAGFLGWVQFQADTIFDHLDTLWNLLAGLAEWLWGEIDL